MTPLPMATIGTSASDYLWWLVVSLGLGLGAYLKARHRHGMAPAQGDEAERVAGARGRWPAAFLVAWLPWLLFCLLTMGLSVLCERGIVSPAWAGIVSVMLLLLWLGLARRLLLP